MLRIAGIVADFQPKLFAEHAAGGIDVGDRLFGAVAELAAEGRLSAGHRARDRDGDVVGQCGRAPKHGNKRNGEQAKVFS